MPTHLSTTGCTSTVVFLIATVCVILIQSSFCRESAASSPTEVRRFALVMGANDGGGKRMLLRYAKTDALAFAKVLHEIGGVRNNDRMLITTSNKSALQRGFDKMKLRLQQAKHSAAKIEMIFYYSGHSDERGLLLGDDIFSFTDLKKQLDSMPAKVKIGILDSCASGALVRIKGGTRTAPFLVDASTEVSGYALLTSSSADENAQESERIGASYFTHYLISGLRGAADTNRDGRVTLNESYAYAFDETLYRTESSRGGPQHPNYDFQLAGAGDLVLTDLRTTDASLGIPKSLVGRIYIRDSKGRLIAEINKSSQKNVNIALPKGKYEVSVDEDNRLRRGFVHVKAGVPTTLNPSHLSIVKKEHTRSRGNQTEEVTYQKLSATVTPKLTTNVSNKVDNHLSANIIGIGWSLHGLEVGVIRNFREHSVHGVQFAMLLNHTHHLSGMQRGTINIAKGDVKGVQSGMINIAGNFTRGAQIGLYNTTKEKSNAVQFGFINHMPDGMLSIGAWTSDTSLFTVGVKLGGRHTFSKFAMSTRAHSINNWFSLAYGFGGHFEAPRVPLWVEIDCTGHWLVSDLEKLNAIDALVKTKLSFGIRLFGTLSFFAGPLLNTLISDQRSTVALLPPIESGSTNGFNYEISPGFFAGFQIEPKIKKFNTWKGNLDNE